MNKKVLNIVLFIVLTLVCFVLLILFYCIINTTHKVTVTPYTIATDLDNPLRIVQLTDLHEVEFGENNIDLVEAVKEQNPDIIVITGDMQNKDDEDTSIVCNLVRNLSTIAEVYYGYGNHEKTWEKNFDKDFANLISEAGAIVVDNRYVDIEVNGNNLRIAGYMGYYSAVHMTAHTEEEQKQEQEFEKSFESTDRYKILLNHIPTSWVDWGYTNDYPIDLVFSGHYHGGQMVLPFVGPLYAPYIGFFPDNVKGVYQGNQTTCILSAGLGTEYFVPRVNNPPEIVVVDLKGKE